MLGGRAHTLWLAVVTVSALSGELELVVQQDWGCTISPVASKLIEDFVSNEVGRFEPRC